MTQNRATHKRAADQLPMVLVGVADPAKAGTVAHALHLHGMGSVIAFTAQDILLQLEKPDGGRFVVVVLDSRLAATNGELATIVADVRAHSRALIVTLGATPTTGTVGDFDLPPDAGDEMVAANVYALASERGHHHGVTRWGPWQVDLSTWEATWDSISLPLTTQQLQILDVLVAAAGATISAQELAMRLHEGSFPFDAESIRAHMTRLRKRIRQVAPAAADALITVHGKGYRLARDSRPAEGNPV